MNKVLIVDDEYLVRLGIRSTFHWALHGFEIVGEASNGRDAIKLFEKTDPDILLTDIRMPVMDGIELIEDLKARKPGLYVVILTNYDDFSYAQRAIRLGAAQYILKSDLREETLLEALCKCEGGRENAPEHRREAGPLERSIRSALFQRNSGRLTLSQEMTEQFQPGLYAVVACRCDVSGIPQEAQEKFHKTCRTMLEGMGTSPLLVSAEADEMLRALLITRLRGEAEYTHLRDGMRTTISNLHQYYDVEMRMGISAMRQREHINRMIEQAFEALDLCFFRTGNDCEWCPQKKQPEKLMVRYRSIDSLIQAHEWLPLKAEIGRIFEQLYRMENMAAAESCCIELMSIARQAACGNILLGEEFLRDKQLEHLAFRTFDHICAMEVYVMDIYRSMMNLLSGRGKRYSSIITKAVDFIQANYARPISLVEVAEEVDVSKSYLSLLFKQETGINFSKYLMDYRIDRSKQLLSQSTLRIYEIAEQVGFLNPYYFSKVFRDYTGMSCKDYRNAYSDHPV